MPRGLRSRSFVRGFTLVELLVVVSIIALLIAILLPSLRRARDQAKLTKCMAGLRGIGVGLFLYADDNKQEMPDYYAVGKYQFRVAPGNFVRTPLADGNVAPSMYPESWGLQAVLESGCSPKIMPNGVARFQKPSRPVYLAADSDVWICPSNPGPADPGVKWKEFGNTYTYRVKKPDDTTGKYTKPWYNVDWINTQMTTGYKQPLLWDNYMKYPGRPGFNGPFDDGYTIPEKYQRAPHRIGTKKSKASWVAFYARGHCQVNYGLKNQN